MDRRVDFPIFKIIERDNDLSLFARALALPIRIAILRVLITEGCWINQDVFAQMPFSPVARENHLRALIVLGVVKKKVFNRSRYYSINEETMKKMAESFSVFFEYHKQHIFKQDLNNL